ncbi:hypothetical protein D6D26_06481, partial [Aureobasidium pullulans]
MPKMSTTTSAKDDAIAFASQKCFHQSITIGPTSAHQKLRVSFATTSGFDDEGKNGLETILFCGGMGASRLLLYRFDALAKKEGVRVRSHASSFFLSTSFFFLFFWLPGMDMLIFNLGFQAGGGWFDTSSSGSKSTSMVGRRARRTRASRRQDYITTIPLGGCDLRHQHPPPAPSSPTSPSPIRRFFKYAISSPPSPLSLSPKKQALLMEMPNSSLAPLMKVVDKLPSALVGSLHHITSFVGGYIAPSVQFSSGMMGVTDDLPEDQCQTHYDMSSKSWSEVCKLQGKYARLEDMRYAFALLCFAFSYSLPLVSFSSIFLLGIIYRKVAILMPRDPYNSGISADANLCMQKDSKDWCTHTSLPTTISSLQQLYPQQSRPLTIRAYFAASDQIIGRGGQVYFEECWKRGNDAQGQVDFASKGVDDTDHDNIPL